MGVIIAVIVAYMALMLGIGWAASKKVKTSRDYLIGGKKFGVLLTAMAHQAAGLSGWLFLAWSSQVASMGLAAVWTSVSSGFAPFVNFFALAKKVSRFTGLSGAKSFIDLIEARYYDEDKRVIRVISAVIIFVSITVYMASQLMAAGTTFKAILGWDYKWSIILATAIVTLYTSAGGLLAVVWTDFIQGCLMIFAVLAGAYVAFSQTGSIADIFAAVGQVDAAKMNIWINLWTIVGLLSAGLLGYMGQPQLVQMFMGMENPADSRKSAMVAGCTGVFMLFATLFINMACMVLFPDSADKNTNFIRLIMTYTPKILVGIVTAAILAAVMSSADALLHVVNTTVCQDFYNKLFKNGTANDRDVVLVGRVTALIVGAAAAWIAFNPFEGILWVNWWAWGGLSTFAPVILIGLYWKRATREGAIAALIGGFAGSALWFAAGYYKWLHLTFVAFSAAAILLVVVSWLTSPPPARVQEMVERLRSR
ncbi:sodium/proline symporter [Pyramidobacter sp. SM-530-WT-4B]|uniref:Sodium/proline symporter n=1 Tax=Pyramidobacter porci TaxID=2605789 RepID=A0A6L5YEW7_9BACT|nr:sodium/proline symporter [Pyramidobacter porci]MST56645.1 sodium/proline symporter [Pyramidobacter porci]